MEAQTAQITDRVSRQPSRAAFLVSIIPMHGRDSDETEISRKNRDYQKGMRHHPEV